MQTFFGKTRQRQQNFAKFHIFAEMEKDISFQPWIARGVAKELVGEKLYLYGVVCTAAAKKNSIIKLDRRWLCRGFGQGPKLV
jgi:hypothetical protein